VQEISFFMSHILIIDDDLTFAMMLESLLKKHKYKVSSAYSAASVKRIIDEHTFDVVFTDLRMPDIDGMDIIQLIKDKSPQTQVIMMTGYADISSAIESIKRGAFDYIPKPLNPAEVLNLIKEALQEQKNKTKPQSTQQHQSQSYMEGYSRAAQQLKEHIALVAPTPMSVLLIGESGTGKEYAARLIHEMSDRAQQAFVAVDCGAIPKELVASEFFGHLKGSFTGAVADKTGYFEAANKGTLFLDEVGNLPPSSQAQLLRVLQERKVKPIGSNFDKAVDVRVIAATNENLQQAQENDSFRTDLYHRLNEFQIKLPPVRERKNDIMLFANHFLAQANVYLRKSVAGFDESVEQVFLNYSWPGNLREMKNIVKRATLLCRGKSIALKDIPTELYQAQSISNELVLHNKEEERETIQKALERANYNKSEAARLLNIDRKTLYNKLKRYDIKPSGNAN